MTDPVRAPALPAQSVLGEASEGAVEAPSDRDNTDYAHFYRKKMTRVFVARALRQLAGLESGGPVDQEVS